MFNIEELNQSSFRGIPFYTESTNLSSGHRLTDHNFINSGNLSEDNGLKNKSFTIKAYIGGDNYISQKNAIIKALDIIGSGILVDRFYGTLEVEVDTYSIDESTKDFGKAVLLITFKKVENELVEDKIIKYNVDVRKQAIANFENNFNNEIGEDLLNNVVKGITKFWNNIDDTIKFLEDEKSSIQNIKDEIGKTISKVKTSILSIDSLSNDIVNIWSSFDTVLDLGEFGADPQKSVTNGVRETLQNSADKVYINEAERLSDRQVRTYINTVIAGITQTTINNLENVSFNTGNDFGSVEDDILSIMELLEQDIIIDVNSPIDDIIIQQNLLDAYHISKREFILFYTQKYSGLQNLKDREIVSTIDILNLTMDKYNDINRVDEVLINNNLVDPLFISGNLKLLDR